MLLTGDLSLQSLNLGLLLDLLRTVIELCWDTSSDQSPVIALSLLAMPDSMPVPKPVR